MSEEAQLILSRHSRPSSAGDHTAGAGGRAETGTRATYGGAPASGPRDRAAALRVPLVALRPTTTTVVVEETIYVRNLLTSPMGLDAIDVDVDTSVRERGYSVADANNTGVQDVVLGHGAKVFRTRALVCARQG